MNLCKFFNANYEIIVSRKKYNLSSKGKGTIYDSRILYLNLIKNPIPILDNNNKNENSINNDGN